MNVFAVVTGPPALGRSTLGAALASELGLPLLAQDTIEAGLAGAIGADELADPSRLGGAAVRALLAMARQNGRGVLDGVWIDRARAVEELSALPAPVVEVFCARPRGVVDERWDEATLTPLAGEWPVLEVDTSGAVDVLALAQRVDADAGLAAHGVVHRGPLNPVEPMSDLAILRSRGVEVAQNLVAGGVVPDAFGVVITRRGVPELVMPPRWMGGPPSWTMGWGEPDPSPFAWVRGAIEQVHHRAYMYVAVDEEARVVRLEGEHRDGTRYEQTESLDP